MAGTSRKQITVADVVRALDQLAPPHLAQSWDNVGLLAGDGRNVCRSILLCVDLTPAVLEESVTTKCQLVVAYHPPLFKPIRRLRGDGSGTDSLVHRAIAAGIAIYSPHTALDAAPGGTNDVLAELCGLTECEPFEYAVPPATQSKVVTFVPREQVDKLAGAMFAAGAGRIGDYEQCSYRLAGEGTFFGTEGTDPKVGRRGRLEKVSEIRLEMIAANHRLPEVIDALLSHHPYEEPAYDIYPLSDTPSFGIGRVGQLPPRTTLASLARGLKKLTRSKVAMMIGVGKTPLRRAAVCVGSAGMLPFDRPRSTDCDVIVTGEIRHHDALSLLRMGRTAIALGHWESERPVLPVLARRLVGRLCGVSVRVSAVDRPPLATVS